MKRINNEFYNWSLETYANNPYVIAYKYGIVDRLNNLIVRSLTHSLYVNNKGYFPEIEHTIPEKELINIENQSRKNLKRSVGKKKNIAKKEKERLYKLRGFLEENGMPVKDCLVHTEKAINEARNYEVPDEVAKTEAEKELIRFKRYNEVVENIIITMDNIVSETDFTEALEEYTGIVVPKTYVEEIVDVKAEEEKRKKDIKAIEYEFLYSGNFELIVQNRDRLKDVDGLVAKYLTRKDPSMNPKKINHVMHNYDKYIDGNEKNFLGRVLESKIEYLDKLEVVYVNGDINRPVEIQDIKEGTNYTINPVEKPVEYSDSSRGGHEYLGDVRDYEKKLKLYDLDTLKKDINETIPERIAELEAEEQAKKDELAV